MTAAPTQPVVLNMRTRPSGVALELRVPATLSWFLGHFASHPILPGVVQLAWVIAYARAHFGLDPAVERIIGLKFQRIIRPGAELELDLLWSPANRSLDFQFRERAATCSSGRFVLTR